MDSGIDRLDGWKEISHHLRCDVRTCLRWEKEAGLPIHRISRGAKRSKVFAYKTELDRWMAGDTESRESSETGSLRPAGRWAVLLAGAGVLVLALVVWWVRPSPSSGPVAYKVKGQALIFYDTQDRELWHLDIDSPVDLETFYKDEDHPFVRNRLRVVLKDIDGDGRNEAAALVFERDPAKRKVVLYDHDGEVLWEQTPAFGVQYAQERPGSTFRPVQLGLEDIDGDGRTEVLALWAHERHHPGLFEVMSERGKRLFQYDHIGVLQSFVVLAHPNRAGIRQILLGGTNSLLGGDAVLVVLDTGELRSGLGPPYTIPAELQSQSPDLIRFVPVNPRRAAQHRYLRFPHNELSRANGTFWLNVHEMLPSNVGYSIQVDYGSKSPAYFKFDPGFSLLGVQHSSDLKRRYDELLAAGTLTTPLEDFLETCLRTVLQWDGTQWVPVPVRR
ncbi:MAG: VCBS repeat-containing protein [Acidobacteriota bacterium]